MTWLVLPGMTFVAVSLLMGLWMEHLRERPVYERPSILVHSWFWILWLPARWILFAAGFAALGFGSPPAAVLLALVLFGLWTWKRALGSPRHRRRMIRRAYLEERARDPSASDAQILERILHSLHGRWGEELIEQIVADHPTPEAVADMVVRMERGILPSGFHPRRTLPKGR